jgi:tRNA threonylcarbamoyladenosine biosynthesis protein TsaB
MAAGMRAEGNENDLFCPMIDARRMEVYCALFDRNGKTIADVSPKILDENSFTEELKTKRIFFSGDGAEKFRTLVAGNSNAVFTEAGIPSAKHLSELAYAKFTANKFEDVAYFEPFYLKQFVPGRK